MRKAFLFAVLAGCALFPSLALADAREDVVAGVARCAVLSDDRQWLDCYYGAAQPMRGALGLAPAPQAQVKLLQAQPARGAPLPATVARAAVRSGPPPMPRSSSMLDFTGGDDVVRNTPVKSYEVNRDGFKITLPDGQVWEQTADDASKRPVNWRDPASSMRVTVSQGAMHTFNLVLGDETTHHKVKRIH